MRLHKESSMDPSLSEWSRLSAQKVLKKLKKRGINGVFLKNAAEARQHIMEMIPQGASITRGGSMSLEHSGVWQAVCGLPGVRVLDPFGPGVDRQASLEVRLKPEALSADVFLASVNAITLDGELVNLDATGNRIAAISFGPRRVILLAGINKLVGQPAGRPGAHPQPGRPGQRHPAGA
jgi:hypothetical protein